MFYIFDWDGTLSDSAAKITMCMQLAAKELGQEARSADQIRNIIGLGLPEAIRTLYPEITQITQHAFRDAYSHNFTLHDQQPSEFFPAVMETLTQLRDNGCALAVATGKSRRGLDRVLGRLGLADFFHYSRCADETASKPDPLMLQELLDEASCSVEQAVMVGDTEWDMRMADNIGMPKIAVSYGAHDKQRLLDLKPDLFIDSFETVLEWRFPAPN